MPAPYFAVGDLVEWTKPTVRGVYTCRVVALSTQPQQPFVVEIVGHCWNQNSPRIGERHAVSGAHLRHAL
jgi:hypothetical protein